MPTYEPSGWWSVPQGFGANTTDPLRARRSLRFAATDTTAEGWCHERPRPDKPCATALTVYRASRDPLNSFAKSMVAPRVPVHFETTISLCNERAIGRAPLSERNTRSRMSELAVEGVRRRGPQTSEMTPADDAYSLC